MVGWNPLILKPYFDIIFCSILGELDIMKLKSIYSLIKHDDPKPAKLFNNQVDFTCMAIGTNHRLASLLFLPLSIFFP